VKILPQVRQEIVGLCVWTLSARRSTVISLAALAGSCGLAVSAIRGIPGILGFIALTIAASSIVSASSTFWSLPTAYLSGAAASAGIAWINSVGNLGGYVGPSVVGYLSDATHSTSLALLIIACGPLLSAILVATVFKKRLAPAAYAKASHDQIGSGT
jgi:nitrate/nitrite transporter NarK